MTVTLENRSLVRSTLTGLLSTALVGTSKPCAAVYGYMVANFQGQSPVVCVTSSGTARTKIAEPLVVRGVFYIDIHIFSLYAMKDATISEDDSEDNLDYVEMSIFNVLMDTANYVKLPYWNSLDQEGRSITDIVEDVNGNAYRHEVISLAVKIKSEG